jgi:hypothetical protein
MSGSVTARTLSRLQIRVRLPTVRIVTPDLVSPGVLQLRLLEKRLEPQLARMDARVDELLMSRRAPSDAEVGELDVLLASIAEVRELLEEARAEAARETLARRARRARPRRWV